MTQLLYITTRFKIYIFIYTPNRGQCHKTADTRPKPFKYSLTGNSHRNHLYCNSTGNCQKTIRSKLRSADLRHNSHKQRKHCKRDSFSNNMSTNAKEKCFHAFTVLLSVPANPDPLENKPQDESEVSILAWQSPPPGIFIHLQLKLSNCNKLQLLCQYLGDR